MWSRPLSRTFLHCRVEFWLYQVEMQNGGINILVDVNNRSVMSMRNGNNHATYVHE